MSDSKYALEFFLKEYSLKFTSNTYQTYKRTLEAFLSQQPSELDAIDRKSIKKWLIELSNKNNGSTIRTKISAIRTFFNFCEEEDLILKNPAKTIDIPPENKTRIINILSTNQIYQLREATKENIRDRAIVEVYYCTGVRVSELINMKIINIRFDERTIWVEDTKNQNDRLVLFTNECEVLLKRYLKSRENINSDFLFLTRRGKPFTRQGVWKMFKGYMNWEKGISAKNLRHTFATVLLKKGVKLNTVTKLLGHKRVKSTMVYVHLDSEDRRTTYRKYNSE